MTEYVLKIPITLIDEETKENVPMWAIVDILNRTVKHEPRNTAPNE